MPAAASSLVRRRRASATLDGVYGSSTAADGLTSSYACSVHAYERTRYERKMPRVALPETATVTFCSQPGERTAVAGPLGENGPHNVTARIHTAGLRNDTSVSSNLGRQSLRLAVSRDAKARYAVAEPMVVVDDLHIVYRVYGAGGNKGTAATALMRVLRRQNRPGLREVHAIRGISFVAYRGDAVGIIGRNGSGKSTLLRAIAGLLPPESGAVYTTGEASLLGVNAALLDDLTGERNVVLGCLAMGMEPAEVKSRYNDIVEFAGVGAFIDLPMRAYSSGMGVRLCCVSASAKSHDVLLIDEALATGDAPFRT